MNYVDFNQFVDNELSPECLDGAQRLLRGTYLTCFEYLILSDGGVCIPQSYTAVCVPVSTSKLHESVGSYTEIKHFETPYVVKYKAAKFLGMSYSIFIS